MPKGKTTFSHFYRINGACCVTHQSHLIMVVWIKCTNMLKSTVMSNLKFLVYTQMIEAEALAGLLNWRSKEDIFCTWHPKSGFPTYLVYSILNLGLPWIVNLGLRGKPRYFDSMCKITSIGEVDFSFKSCDHLKRFQWVHLKYHMLCAMDLDPLVLMDHVEDINNSGCMLPFCLLKLPPSKCSSSVKLLHGAWNKVECLGRK